MRAKDSRTAAVVCLATALLLAPVSSRADEAPPTSPTIDEFPVELGSFSTTLIGSLPARTHNVRLAATALDGTVLEPGAELSFNVAVGPRTADRGYLVAPVILREQRQLQLGGGICQVASTLFAASLIVGLMPIERTRHSSPVDFIALGEDATIAWGFKDLRVRNDLELRVRLRVEIVGSTLTAGLDGEAATDNAFDLLTEEREVPASSENNLRGHEVELYRVRRVGGEEMERELVHRDLYPSARSRAAVSRATDAR